MKQLLLFFFLATVFVTTLISCGSGESSSEAVDSIITEPEQGSTELDRRRADSLQALQNISDSFNLAITKMNSVIKLLYDSAQGRSDTQRRQIMRERTNLINIRNAAINARNSMTSAAIQQLVNKLRPTVDLLKQQLLSLQKIGEAVDDIVAILNIVDKAIATAIASGLISAPVVIPAS